VIYVKRNPKDTVVSYFHFARMLALSSYRGSFEDFLRKFESDQVPYGPYFDHLESYVENQEDPNLLILSYEELSASPADVVRRIGVFLERPLTDEEVSAIVEHTKFESMAVNPSVNYSHWDEIGMRNKGESLFLRKGQVGDWRNYFSKRETLNLMPGFRSVINLPRNLNTNCKRYSLKVFSFNLLFLLRKLPSETQ